MVFNLELMTRYASFGNLTVYWRAHKAVERNQRVTGQGRKTYQNTGTRIQEFVRFCDDISWQSDWSRRDWQSGGARGSHGCKYSIFFPCFSTFGVQMYSSSVTFQALIRFHLEMMFGLRSSDDPLPPPATAQEEEEWDCERDLDDITIEMHKSSDGVTFDSEIDPCFPYPNGPGHQEASPQQLSVTWELMKAARVPSFRPNLSASPSSKGNKRIWGLAERIFFKLVTLGVYTGISLDQDNIPFIKRCFSSHIQTLMKR